MFPVCFISSGARATNCPLTLTKRRWGWRLLQTGLLGLLCFHPFSPSLSVIATERQKCIMFSPPLRYQRNHCRKTFVIRSLVRQNMDCARTWTPLRKYIPIAYSFGLHFKFLSFKSIIRLNSQTHTRTHRAWNLIQVIKAKKKITIIKMSKYKERGLHLWQFDKNQNKNYTRAPNTGP